MDFLRSSRLLVRLLYWAALILLVLLVFERALQHMVGWLGLIILIGVTLVLMVINWWFIRHVPPRTILEVNFEHGLVEYRPDDSTARLMMGKTMTVRDVTDALYRAADDPRIVGFVARIGSGGLGLAHAQELREAVTAFRNADKRTVAWCQTLGEGENASVTYYLAAAFEKVHLQPLGQVSFIGLLLEQPFLRGLLDRVGIVPRLDHREQFKSAKYMFTEDHLTEPHRESLEAVLSSQVQQIIDGIANDRHIEPEKVRQLMEQGPFDDNEAVHAGLVDSLTYQPDLRNQLKADLGGRWLDLLQYLRRAGRVRRGRPAVALIHGTGIVMRGRHRIRRLPPTINMGADDLAAAFRSAIDNKHIKAIVFRVDSPGGSAVASEAIWREVQRAREAGKPVVASMGNLAGSGGYYIVAGADRIVAQPGTITGSIGVVSGKMVTRDAWKRIGIDWGSVGVGANADYWSSLHNYSDTGWQKMQASLDRVYDRFKKRVAQGRGLDAAQVDAVAKGRIWTGRSAHEQKLVDELGGLNRAIDLACELASLAKPREAGVLILPRPSRLPPWLGLTDRDDATSQLAEEATAWLEPVARTIAWSSPEQYGELIMPGFKASSRPHVGDNAP